MKNELWTSLLGIEPGPRAMSAKTSYGVVHRIRQAHDITRELAVKYRSYPTGETFDDVGWRTLVANKTEDRVRPSYRLSSFHLLGDRLLPSRSCPTPTE